MTSCEYAPLSPDALLHLRNLVARMDHHRRLWATAGGGERLDNGTISMPGVEANEAVPLPMWRR